MCEECIKMDLEWIDESISAELSNYGIAKLVLEEGPKRLKIDTNGMNDHVLIDAYTASAIVQVFDALNNENKLKLNSIDFLMAVDIVWKIFNKFS